MMGEPIAPPLLAGKRIAISRPPEQAGPLIELLLPLGATVCAAPLVRIEGPRDPEPLRAAAARLERYDWVVVTSGHGALALARARGDHPWPMSVQVAAVGESTASALTRLGVKVSLVPNEASGAGLAAALAARAPGAVSGRRVLFVRSNIAGRALPDSLRAAGAMVDEVEAYTTALDLERARELWAALDGHRFDAVVLTSPSNAEALFSAAGNRPAVPVSVRLISIGPTTSARLADLGRPPDAEASRPDVTAILEAICTALR